MKASVFLLFTALLFFAACKNEPPASQAQTSLSSIPSDTLPDEPSDEPLPVTPVFLKKFTGKVGGNEVEMVLSSWGDGLLTGHYFYKKQGKPIELNGEMQEDNSFKISEYVGDNETGNFTGNFANINRLTGNWTSADQKKTFPFDLAEAPSTDDKAGWTGDWFFNDLWAGGFLLIGNVTKNSFDFALSVSSGGNSGIAEGQAKITLNKAVFETREFTDEPCLLRFEHRGKGIMIAQEGADFACGFGNGVQANGTFEPEKRQVKPTLKVGKDESSIFSSQAQHDAFKKLTGDSLYETFAFNLQLISKSKPNPKDKLTDVSVVSGGVQGLFSQCEAIIISDPKGKFWAATLDFDKSNDTQLVVRYVTNDERFKSQLPATIEDWRENFKDYRVVFEGGKKQNL